MKHRNIVRTGIVGTVIAAICCFTPVLVIAFGILGISAWMGWWLDYLILFPALIFFMGLTGYGIYRRR